MRSLRIAIVLFLCIGLYYAIKPTTDSNINTRKQKQLINTIEDTDNVIEINIPKFIPDEVTDYEEEINLNNEISPLETQHNDRSADTDGIGIIEIESIDLRLPVIEGINNEKLKIAVGHIPSSSQIGEVGNCILIGHRNYNHGELFNRLDEINAGDMIIFTDINGKVFKYRVYAVTVIASGDKSLFEYEDGQKKLTLLTCTPIRKATHRLLVQAELIE